MTRSAIAAATARKFPAISREILKLSVQGHFPPLHRHWLGQSLARDLFEDRGFPMWGSSCRLYIPRELYPVYLEYFNFLDHEPLTRKIFASLIKPGSVVIDVGANIGYYTLLAADRIGPQGKVHSVECSPDTLVLLRENVRRNALKNVEIYPVAASNTRGDLTLNVSAIGLSLFELHSSWSKVSRTNGTVTVPSMPMDDLVHSPVDVVKIDAEGADLDVLKGMSRLLSENKNISVIVEWAPPLIAEAGKDPLELPRWLQDAGFKTVSVLEEGTNKQLSLDRAIEMVRGNQMKSGWVGDLFAQRR
jgi:FkbM family methyltransferase